MTSKDVGLWLQDEYSFNVIAIHNILNLNDAPYNTIYKILNDVYKEVYNPLDRIVFFSSDPIPDNILTYIKEAIDLINISNNFILMVSPDQSIDAFLHIKKQLSSNAVPYAITSDIAKPLPDNFCFMPWANLKITNQGNFKHCCVYKKTISNKDKELHISTSTIQDAYFSDDLEKLRDAFKENLQPKECSHCWDLEKNGLPSHRQRANNRFYPLISNINLEEISTSNLVSFDIDLGITCNLKCRICGPHASSRILKERLLISTTAKLLDIQSKSNFIKNNDSFWKMFDPLLPSIRILEFYGGEPTLISNHRLLLQKLIDNNNAKDIKLHYNTNGTNFSNELVELWQHFKEVDLAFSIDDIGNRFEYQRSGANWEDVNRNLDQYLNLPRSIHKFSLFVTVNIQNVLYLPELLDWFDTKTFDTFHINALEQPKHFNIQYLNRYTKDIIIKKIKESAHIDRLTGIVKILSGDNLIKTDFANHIKEIDKIRSENFADSHPEMADIIGYVL